MRTTCFVFLLLSLAPSALAAPSTSKVSVSNFCQDLLNGENADELSPLVPLSKTSKLLMTLFPSYYVDIDRIGEKSENETNSRSNGAIIFSLDEPTGNYYQEEAQLKNLAKKIFSVNRNPLEFLKNASDQEECLARAAQLGLTDSVLQDAIEDKRDITANGIAQLADSGLTFLRDAVGAAGAVYPVRRWSDIIAITHSLPEGKYDFVIMFHADKDGRLYDSEQLVVPAYFFSDMKGKARSLTYFSCFPNAVETHYAAAFSDLEQSGTLIYKPSLNGTLRNSSETPVGLFPAFAQKLGDQLSR